MKSNNQNGQDQKTHIIPPKKTVFNKIAPKKKAKSGGKPAKEHINVKAYHEYEFHIPVHQLDMYAAQILGSRNTQQDMFSISGATDIFSDETPVGWAVVCDGMGGMSSGELASQTADAVMHQILGSTSLDANIPEILSQAIFVANEEVKKITAGTNDVSGTTLVSVVANGNQLYYASVGDSRIYLCRGNEIGQLTRDHNYAMELDQKVQAGKMTMEEALSSSQREALMSYVGISELELVDISAKPIIMQNEDIIILCSDGLTKVFPDEEILRLVNLHRNSPKEIVEVLLNEVQNAYVRNLDNTTIAVLKYYNG